MVAACLVGIKVHDASSASDSCTKFGTISRFPVNYLRCLWCPRSQKRHAAPNLASELA